MEITEIQVLHDSIVYVIPTYKCNLNCQHCDQLKLVEEYEEDHEALLSNLQHLDDSCKLILFGGEPLLAGKRLLSKMFNAKQFWSISTNLLKLDDGNMKLLKEYNIKIATSWNPGRFTEKQHEKWIYNIRKLNDEGLCVEVVCIVLVDGIDVEDTLKEIELLDTLKVKNILFQPLVPSIKSQIEAGDEFLTAMEFRWSKKWQIRNITNFCNSCENCQNTFTLHPNGKLTKYCPHNNGQQYGTPEECFECIFYKNCHHCVKQHSCTFFKKAWKTRIMNDSINISI